MAGRQPGFWDVEHRLRELSAQGDPLEKLAATVDFEIFRAGLEAAMGSRDRSKGGRPPFDPVLKFRMLVLQAMHGLSLAQTEFLVADRLSWMRFCRLGPGDAVPDANTLWDFREALIAAGALDALFARLDRAITEAGYLPMSGQIVDATLVAAPRQRNTETEKARIRAGETAADIWPDKPAKARQKDVDARWTVKHSKAKPAADGKPQIDIAVPAFGYKSHISIDRRHGIIRRAKVTDAFGAALGPVAGWPLTARRGAAARGADRPEQHRLGRLGRQRLPLGGERAVPRRHRQGQPHPPPQAEGPADAEAHGAGECREIRRPRSCRASLRAPEGADGNGDPHHRPRARHGHRDARQHRLQHEAMVLARQAESARMRLRTGRPPPQASRSRHEQPVRGARTDLDAAQSARAATKAQLSEVSPSRPLPDVVGETEHA